MKVNIKNNTMKNQAEIVRQRLKYHFGGTDSKWNIPEGMPFMQEFLDEVEKLCEMVLPEIKYRVEYVYDTEIWNYYQLVRIYDNTILYANLRISIVLEHAEDMGIINEEIEIV